MHVPIFLFSFPYCSFVYSESMTTICKRESLSLKYPADKRTFIVVRVHCVHVRCDRLLQLRFVVAIGRLLVEGGTRVNCRRHDEGEQACKGPRSWKKPFERSTAYNASALSARTVLSHASSQAWKSLISAPCYGVVRRTESGGRQGSAEGSPRL